VPQFQFEGQGQPIVKILLLGINYWPDETGIAPFNTGRCEHLASRGHEITVCTAPPYYPEWRIPDKYRRGVLTKEHRNGVTILRSWLYVPRQVTAAKRLLHEASFIASSLLSLFRAGKPDIIVVISAPLGLGLTASILSKIWRVPFVFHVEDLQPDAAADLGMMSNRAIIGPLYALERRIYRRADLVTTLTEGMRSRIIAKGIPKEKVSLSTHWSESRLFDIPTGGGAVDFRRREGLENAFVVVHAGNMGVKQGLEVVVDAARLTRNDERIVYLFVGDGASRSGLEQRTAALSLRNVRFMGVRYGDDFREVLSAADVCLVTQRRGVAEILFPSKVLTILAAARPVLASLGAETEVARVLSESGGALVLEPEDPKALADAVLSTRENPFVLHRMAVSGRAYAQSRWSRDVALSRMEQQLTSIAARQKYARVSNTAYGENEI
jgi:colanic acid biosynthesis glycosyl transferase WcaI